MTTTGIDLPPAPAAPVAPPPRARIVITGRCDGLADLLDTLAGHPELELRGWCEEIGEAAGLLAGDPAAVLHAVQASAAPESAIAAIREHTQAPVLLVVAEAEPDEIDNLSAHERVELLRLPASAEQVVAAVWSLRGDERQRRRPALDSRMLTVFSPKGGTGKSVLAANLAVSLAAEGVRTLLVDLQLERGDAALILGIDPERTVHDLVNAPGDLDADKLAGYTTRHPSGLDVLPAPLRPEHAELVTETAVDRVLELAATSYDAVVVDTPASFHPALLAALDRTDELLLVCELDVTTLKNARMTLETLALLRFPADRISIVLNQTGPARALKRSELETALGGRVRFEVPYDEGVPVSVGRGTPLVLERSDFSRAVARAAWELVPKAARATRPRPSAVRGETGDGSRRSRWAPLRRG